jgi:hypothetical protein
MPSDHVSHLVADAVEQHVPVRQPPFEALVGRWRRRRTVRRAATAGAVVAAVALTTSVVLVAGSGGRAPQVTGSPAPSVSRPAGPVPYDVTGVTACIGADCRTVTDVDQVLLLVGDLNAGEAHQTDEFRRCEPDPVGIELTFTGPNGPYPVVDVLYKCSWWTVRGSNVSYDDRGAAGVSAHQAQRHGLVVHDCGVTSGSFGPEFRAADYVGLTLDDATALAARRGVELRVRGRDGRCTAVPLDGKGTGRVNLYLENGRVATAAYG